MLSREENDLLCRVGPGTVMGDFVRQYWGQSWVTATEEARKSDAGAPIAWAPLPV